MRRLLAAWMTGSLLATGLMGACTDLSGLSGGDADEGGAARDREDVGDAAQAETSLAPDCGCPAPSTCVEAGCFFRETWEGPTGSAWPAYWIVDAQSPIPLPVLDDGGGTFQSADAGTITLQPDLPAATEVDQVVSIASNETTTLFGLFCRAKDGRSYRARSSDGRDLVLTVDHADGGSTQLGKVMIPQVGIKVRMRLQCVTIQPGLTELRLSVWQPGSTEPAQFGIIRPDNGAALQGPGAFGVRLNPSRSLSYRLDDYEVTFR